MSIDLKMKDSLFGKPDFATKMHTRLEHGPLIPAMSVRPLTRPPGHRITEVA